MDKLSSEEDGLCPLISILVPVFNREDYIEPCILSALAQTEQNFEIIVCDNASEDRTWPILEKLNARDSRIRIFRNEENLGPVRNWQRCIEKARGQYSKILFSDDLLEPDCLRKMLPAIEARPEVAFVFCSSLIGTSPETSRSYYGHGGDVDLDHQHYLNALMEDRAPVSPGAILIRTSDLAKNLLLQIPSVQHHAYESHGAGPDVMISLLTTLDYQCVSCVAEPLVFFRYHSDSFSVMNEGGQVQKAYISAIAYFLKHNGYESQWSSYVFGNWLNAVLRSRQWLNPAEYAVAHEGSGSLLELVRLFFYGFKKRFSTLRAQRD